MALPAQMVAAVNCLRDACHLMLEMPDGSLSWGTPSIQDPGSGADALHPGYGCRPGGTRRPSMADASVRDLTAGPRAA